MPEESPRNTPNALAHTAMRIIRVPTGNRHILTFYYYESYMTN